MKNTLLKFGLFLTGIGGCSAIILCVIALFNIAFFPIYLILFSFIALISGSILFLIDSNNDTKKLKKIINDLDILTMTMQKKEISYILYKGFINLLIQQQIQEAKE
jgi:hypothetical protein